MPKIIYLAIGLAIFPACGFSQKLTDTRSQAQAILDGKVRPTDDKATFSVLDSLFCKNKADRKFYFEAANKIRQLSDGALSEYFSGIASRYYLEDNPGFIANSYTIPAKQVDAWLEQAAFDIAGSANDKQKLPEIRQRLNALIAACKCGAGEQERIKVYNTILYQQVKDQLEHP